MPFGRTDSNFLPEGKAQIFRAKIALVATMYAVLNLIAACSAPIVIRNKGYNPSNQISSFPSNNPLFALAAPQIAGPCPEVTFSTDALQNREITPSDASNLNINEMGLTRAGDLFAHSDDFKVIFAFRFAENSTGNQFAWEKHRDIPIIGAQGDLEQLIHLRATIGSIPRVMGIFTQGEKKIHQIFVLDDDSFVPEWSFHLPTDHTGMSYLLDDADTMELAGIWQSSSGTRLLQFSSQKVESKEFPLQVSASPIRIIGLIKEDDGIVTQEQTNKGLEKIWLNSLTLSASQLVFEGRLATQGSTLSMNGKLAISVLKDLDQAYHPLFSSFAVGGVWQTSLREVLRASPERPVSFKWNRLSPFEVRGLEYRKSIPTAATDRSDDSDLFGVLIDDLTDPESEADLSFVVRSFLFGKIFRTETEINPSCSAPYLLSYLHNDIGVIGSGYDNRWYLLRKWDLDKLSAEEL